MSRHDKRVSDHRERMKAGDLLLPIDRAALCRRLREPRQWDLAVIGGGATGLGVALDAAARGFPVVCVDANGFAKVTSSRATKLVHGGVRYLAEGNVALVYEALRERAALLANAPHLAQRLPFVMPSYRWWERAFYGAGLKMYDALADAGGIGHTESLSSERVRELLPACLCRDWPAARSTGTAGSTTRAWPWRWRARR